MTNLLFYEKETIDGICDQVKFLQQVIERMESGESNWKLEHILKFLEQNIKTPLAEQTCGSLMIKDPIQ